MRAYGGLLGVEWWGSDADNIGKASQNRITKTRYVAVVLVVRIGLFGPTRLFVIIDALQQTHKVKESAAVKPCVALKLTQVIRGGRRFTTGAAAVAVFIPMLTFKT
jgi:hypothetical protein